MSEKATHYYDLSGYIRVANIKSQVAHNYFSRGLVWCYLFNHEASIQYFEAASHDKTYVMVYWGLACAVGPSDNKSWKMFT